MPGADDAGRGAAGSGGAMSCIRCGADASPADVVCRGCGHPFVFPPSAHPLAVTDRSLGEAIGRVSAEGTLRFTERQLWYELGLPHRDRRYTTRRKYPYLLFAFCGAFPGMVTRVFFPVPATFWVAGAGAVAALALRAYLMHREARRPLDPPHPPSLSLEALQGHLPRWVRVNGPVPGLLPRDGALPGPGPRPADGAGPHQVVVTDTRETAEVLVANGFDAEYGCAVLSLDVDPDDARAVADALRRTPGLTVFALHDATPAGCHLPLALRQPAWFPDPAVRIVDLGLRPEIAWRLRVPARSAPPVLRPPLPAWLLSNDERTWLAHGNTGELAALRPAYLLRAVHEGMAAAGPYAAGGTDGSAGIVVVDGFV